MPSGAKKRKAAKRRMEQEQQQQLGTHPRGSPTSPTAAGCAHPPQGHCEGEEEDDLTSQEGKESESFGEFTSPSAGDDNCCSLDIDADDEQAELRVVAEGAEKGNKESDTIGVVNTVNPMESTENGGSELPSESPAPQMAEDVVKNEVKVPVAVVEVQKDDIPSPLPPLDPIPPTSTEVPISKVEEVSDDHLQSEKGVEVAVLEDASPSVEHKQLDAVETPCPVEVSVLVSEEVIQASDVPIETLKVVESVAQATSTKNEEKVVSLTDAASEQTYLGVVSHTYTESREFAGTTEVARSTQLQQRTSWMSCCGLFDVITGASR